MALSPRSFAPSLFLPKPPNMIPPELWDRIIDLAPLEDMSSCSLVCASFAARAQSRLFHMAYIGGRDRAERLVTLLSFSPHLIQRIRTLIVGGCGSDILDLMSSIPWSHLEALVLHHSYGRDTPALDQIYSLVGLPSLRTLTLAGGRWQAEHLLAIFDHCTMQLDTIWLVALSGCNLARMTPIPTSSVITSKPRIRRLALTSSRVAELLMHPACSLDVSTLITVRTGGSMDLHLKNLILKNNSTITALQFSATGTWCLAPFCDG